MNIQELTGKVVEAHPALPSALAAQVLRAAFKTIRAEVERTEEGTVPVTGLGTFRVKNVEIEKDGQKTKVRRTFFTIPPERPAAAKTAAAGAAAPAARAAAAARK